MRVRRGEGHAASGQVNTGAAYCPVDAAADRPGVQARRIMNADPKPPRTFRRAKLPDSSKAKMPCRTFKRAKSLDSIKPSRPLLRSLL